MKFVIFTFALLLSTSAFSQTEVTISSGSSIFSGLWQGVDFEDGGNSYRQILSDQNEFELRGRDTWHGPCGYGDPAPITGGLDKTGFYMLEGTWNLDCQAPPTEISGDRELLVEYTYDPVKRTLTEVLISPATGLPIDRTPIIFHKVNTR